MQPSTFFAVLAAFVGAANAHTLVRSVYVNGVDQGTGYGIRHPAYNGPPGTGYPNSPVRNLNSIDVKCNVLGDHPAPDTIKVVPGDVVTFEWGHEDRLPDDGIIADSHHGPVVVYIAPNPPVGNAWVKIFEEGEYAKNQWAATTKLIANRGAHSIQIPAGLAPGKYFLRPELITLHEAEVTHDKNAARGAQLYMECIQIEVSGSGTVTLPAGVDFPGAYAYSDPGINYNVYYTAVGAPPYSIPGPAVWSGAATSVPNPPLGPKKGNLTPTGFSTWLRASPVSMYYSISTGSDGGKTTISSEYTATWPTTYVEPTSKPTVIVTTPSATPTTSTTPTSTTISSTSVIVTPTTTSTPVITTTSTTSTRTSTTSTRTSTTAVACPPGGGGPMLWRQCGGIGYAGATACGPCARCRKHNDYYYQCVPL